MPDGVNSHTLHFPCESLDEANILWKELIKYEADYKSGKLKNIGTDVKPLNVIENKKALNIAPLVSPEVAYATTQEAVMSQMRFEAQCITNVLNKDIHKMRHGYHNQASIQTLLAPKRGFEFEIKSDGGGKFIEIRKGAWTLRVPEDTTQYIRFS